MRLLPWQSLLTVACTVCSRHIQISKLNNVQKEKNEEIEKNQPAAVATAAAAAATTAPAQRQQSWPSSRHKVNRQNKIAWQKNILHTHTHIHTLYIYFLCLPASPCCCCCCCGCNANQFVCSVASLLPTRHNHKAFKQKSSRWNPCAHTSVYINL